jgi:CRISPR-associated protein Csy2
MMDKTQSINEGLLVFPRLRVQNANAISSPMTHGFPAVSAFTGLMHALERKLSAEHGWPLHFKEVGVISHAQQEQVNEGYVKTFNLTRNPLTKEGNTAAIVEEGRMHLEITLIFRVQEKSGNIQAEAAVLSQGNQAMLDKLAHTAARTLATMRIAGGSVLPTPPLPGKRIAPWLEVLANDNEARAKQFRQWRSQWLPGFALVGRDDLLSSRLELLKKKNPDATGLDAWLHAARFNWEAQPVNDSDTSTGRKEIVWYDPYRPKGSGWIVPIPVGYAGLGALQQASDVLNSRDNTTPFRFVEAIYSLGEWISPHRLQVVEELLWHNEFDDAQAIYRCRNGYQRVVGEDDDDDLDDYE